MQIKYGGKRQVVFCLFLLCCLMGVFFSCGIEDYVYLDPVDQGNFNLGWGSIIIPNSSESNVFQSFAIYYRIYISDLSLTMGTSILTDNQRREINPQLASHYNTIEPYIINENTSPSGVGSVFNNLNYHFLSVSEDKKTEISLNSLLNREWTGTIPPVTPGGEITFTFPDLNDAPYMTLKYAAYSYSSPPLYLFRPSSVCPSVSAGSVIAENRLFYLSSLKEDASNPAISADVTQRTNINTKIAYVSMYIVAVGIDAYYSQVYSRPKHIGIFRLPD